MAKQKTMRSPDPESKRSIRRANRGFVSLEVSSRKHKRMMRRQLVSRTHYGKTGNPGDNMQGTAMDFIHKAGGACNFH